eukprot:TRINITY_DN16950_c0_g1_i1.p1 TRINITY_DN16950_c0_g1~~TRINITY_DN16950_c0_g1_i1.p1  ORF type:complete len:580 (+),score=111.34 TRINITY_DN16950_c0_g1_i1:32-1771(+)
MNNAIEDQLKKLIDKHLSEEGVYELVNNDDDVEHVLSILQENYEIQKRETATEGCLKVVIGTCSSLLGIRGRLTSHVQLGKQQFESGPCAIENPPNSPGGGNALFDMNCLFKISDDENQSLLQQRSPLDLTIMNVIDNYKQVLCQVAIPWREALTCQSVSLDVEGKSLSSSVPVCNINVHMEYIPTKGNTYVTKAKLAEQAAMELETERQRCLTLLNYTRRWLGNITSGRMVTPTAYLSGGELRLMRATDFITPVDTAPKVLCTPMHAARFVSLLQNPSCRSNAPACEPSSSVDTRYPPTILFATSTATTLEKATTLVSLLLGFHLDAYVACGINELGDPAYAVIERRQQQEVSAFWNPESGRKYTPKDPLVRSFISEVHCAFDDNKFYANSQVSCAVAETCFRLEEEHLWRVFDPGVGVGEKIVFPELRAPVGGDKERTLSDSVEELLVIKCREYRDGLALGGTVTRKGRIADVLLQSLWLYEQQAVTYKSLDSQKLFENSCSQVVPPLTTLRALPVNHNHCDGGSIFLSLLASPELRSLLETPNANTSIVIRSKVTCYPEDVMSTWTVVAAVYNSTE